MLAVHLATVRLLTVAWTAPEVSEEEGSYAFTVAFQKVSESSESCLLFLVAPPGLIDTLTQLLAWRSLLWLSTIWRWMYLTHSDFLSTTSLEKPLWWTEINIHTKPVNKHTFRNIFTSSQWKNFIQFFGDLQRFQNYLNFFLVELKEVSIN